MILAAIPTSEISLAPAQVEGSGGPGAVRDLGGDPAVNIEEALTKAEKLLGPNSQNVVLPQFWITLRPHLHVT